MRDNKRERDATRVTKEEWDRGYLGGERARQNESERDNERKRERERCNTSN